MIRQYSNQSVGLWQVLLLSLLACWNTSSIAQSEQRLHASQQAAVPEEPYTVEIGVQIDQIVNIDQKSENFRLRVDPYAAIAEKNLKIMGAIDSRRIDRPGIIRMLRNKDVQRMWDVVATHEFPMTEAEEAFKISATQRCGKILLYPHIFQTHKEVTDG